MSAPEQQRAPFRWEHERLRIQAGNVRLDGSALDELARKHGTPLYVYSRATLQRQIGRMQAALAAITHLLCGQGQPLPGSPPGRA